MSYPVGDPDQWQEDIIRDSKRAFAGWGKEAIVTDQEHAGTTPVEPEFLDIPAFIRHDRRVTSIQVNAAFNFIQGRGELPTGIEVIERVGCVEGVTGTGVGFAACSRGQYFLRLEWGADVRLVSDEGKIELPRFIELTKERNNKK